MINTKYQNDIGIDKAIRIEYENVVMPIIINTFLLPYSRHILAPVREDIIPSIIIDAIIKEPVGGAHRNKEEIVVSTKEIINKYLDEFKKYSADEILKNRKNKFLNIGKQKAFISFSSKTSWPDKTGILKSFKKEIIIFSLLVLSLLIYFLK